MNGNYCASVDFFYQTMIGCTVKRKVCVRVGSYMALVLRKAEEGYLIAIF